MNRERVIGLVVVSLLLLAFCPATAAAQSVISGQVRDNTGAVLPGVTVEASSPALIEARRSVVTNGQGQYSIINLRPGFYSLTFTLEGFGKVQRAGIDLPSNFTATINVTLSVGSLEETVTVSGQSPIVDVQQAQRTQVLTREILDSIVTSRNTWSQAQLVAGVTMTGTDVGGSRYVSDLLLEAHGASGLHTTYTVNGMQVNTLINDGRDQNYYQDQAYEQMAIQTSAGSAEISAGGVQLHMVPKEGGNTFKGQVYAGISPGRWQSDNFTPRLKDAGLLSINRVDRIFDYNATLGGPIVKNRIWFFQSWRYWGLYTPVLDRFYDDGTPYRTEAFIWSPVVDVTSQVTPRNKVSVHFDRQGKYSGPKIQAKYPAVITGRGADPETAAGYQDGSTPYYVAQAKWASPVSSRLLLEAGISRTATNVTLLPNPGVEAPVGSPNWYSRVQKTDLNEGVTWNGGSGQLWRPHRDVFSTSATYVTGSHSVKVGTQVNWGAEPRRYFGNGDIFQVRYRSGVPDSVTVRNYPVATNPKMNHDVGVYAQDQWKLNRLTVSGGVRAEWLQSEVGEQNAPAGRFVGERHFPATQNVPNWFNASPRLGVAFDVFGDGRTAVKFSAGRYVTPHTTSFAQRFNPMALTTVALPWNDRDLLGRTLATNGDDIVEDNELDLSRLPSSFGQRQLEKFDPDIKRETNREYGASVQHALRSNVSVSAGYYRRTFHNMYRDDNLLRDFNDYVPVEIVSPYNGEVITAYNLKSATELSQVDTLVSNAGPERRTRYQGFELAMEARLRGGATILASSTTQQTITNTCDVADDPNELRFCDRFNLPSRYHGVPFRRDFKLAGNYTIPFGILLSAKFTSVPGRTSGDLDLIDELLPINWNISRTTRYTAEGCAGRPCTPGALVIPNLVETSLVVPLVPAGTERFLERQTQLDFGVRKTFKMGRLQWQGQFDLFNALNADTILSERSANFGTTAYGVPSEILQGRLTRVALQLRF
jgi:carboxypeptidase family protein